MLSLVAWCSIPKSWYNKHGWDDEDGKQSCAKVQAFAQLGGRNLGWMFVPKSFGKDVFQAIRNLQEQGAKLLVHPKRPCEYLQVFVDGHALPTLTYKTHTDTLKSSLVEQVAQCFDNLTSKTRVELMWNEDDTKAFEKIGRDYYYDCVGKRLRVPVSRWQPEYKVLAYAFNVAKLSMYNYGGLQMLPKYAMMLLANMPTVTKLDLEKLSIQSWDFASKTNIKVLGFIETPIRLSELARFRCLTDLTLEGAYPLGGLRVSSYPLGGLRVSSLETLGLTRLRMSMRCTRDDDVESFKADVGTCTIVDAEITIHTICGYNMKLNTWRSTNRAWTIDDRI